MKPYVEIGPISSRIFDLEIDMMMALDNSMTVDVPGAKWMRSFKLGRWDGKQRFFSLNTGTFLTGFLAEILLFLHDRKIRPTLMYKDKKPLAGAVPIPITATSLTLRDYQEELIRQAMRAGRGVIKAATNAGKTEIAIELISRMGVAALYVVHQRDLYRQILGRFKERFYEDVLGEIGSGTWAPNIVTVGMVQSIVPKLQTYSGKRGRTVFEANVPYMPQLIIADETHHSTSSAWQIIFRRIPAWYRFGMSGTPLQEDEPRDRMLIGFTGPMFASISNTYLIEHGFSAKPTIIFERYTWAPKKPPKERWPAVYRDRIVYGKERNERIVSLCQRHAAQKEQVLVLVNWVEHGLILQALFREQKIPAFFLKGEDDIRIRVNGLKAFKEREYRVLLATTIFDEGIDIPEIDVLIMAGGGGMSPVKPLQRVGRALRRRPDKDEVTIYDFADSDELTLNRHYRRRFDLFSREGFTVKFGREMKA